MKINSVITIGRQFGSGGREIGQELAKEWGIKCYDKELLEIAAKESGISKELFENHDEKPTNSLLYSLAMDSYTMGFGANSYFDMPLNHKVFLAQFDAIKKIALQGPCVIVGRCADYALSEYQNAVHIFIHADMKSKISRISRIYQIPDAKAKDMIVKKDKERASYYNFYTNKKWEDMEGYQLSVDSGVLGIEGSVELIKNYVELREKNIGKVI